MKQFAPRLTKELKMNNNLPIISIEKIEDLSDGSARVTFHYDESFVEFVTKETGIAAPSEKEIGDFVLMVIENAVNKENGWDLSSLSEQEQRFAAREETENLEQENIWLI